MMHKKIVHYNGDVIFSFKEGVPSWLDESTYPDWEDYITPDNNVISATVYGVMDHPRLGRQDYIFTSLVKVTNHTYDEFETLNTIYKRLK
jgi:hypothetical protein